MDEPDAPRDDGEAEAPLEEPEPEVLTWPREECERGWLDARARHDARVCQMMGRPPPRSWAKPVWRTADSNNHARRRISTMCNDHDKRSSIHELVMALWRPARASERDSEPISVHSLKFTGDDARGFVARLIASSGTLSGCTAVAVEGSGVGLDITGIRPDGTPDTADEAAEEKPTAAYGVNLAGDAQLRSRGERGQLQDHRVLEPVPYDFRLPLEQVWLNSWDQDQEDNAEPTADQMLLELMADCIEDEAWNAVYAGRGRYSTGLCPGCLVALDGWLAIAQRAACVVDFEGQLMDTHVLGRMLTALPSPPPDGVFYCPSEAVSGWRDAFDDAPTCRRGDMWLDDDDVLIFADHPVIAVPKIRVDYPAIGDLPPMDYTKVLFCAPANRALGYNPQVHVYAGLGTYGSMEREIVFVNAWGMFDYDYLDADGVVLGLNITPGRVA